MSDSNSGRKHKSVGPPTAPNWQAIDSLVHSDLISRLLESGKIGNLEKMARDLGSTVDEISVSLKRLAENHALVLHPGSSDVWVVHPFSLSPTATWVECEARGWWAPCLWCAFGIAVLAKKETLIHSRLGGEREPVTFKVS